MTTIFYSMTLIFLGYELYVLINVDTQRKLIQNLKNYDSGSEALSSDLMKGCFFSFVTGLYFLWAAVGLFSSNSMLFLLLFLIGIVSYISKKVFPDGYTVFMGIDAFLSIVLLCVIFVNYFM